MDSHANPEFDERKLKRQRRIRVTVFVVSTVLFAILLSTSYEAIQTFSRLEQVERERDQWQRPADVIQELKLNEGSVVVDLGSGVGYFALKLSRNIGKSGKVVAVDIQTFPLYVLRTRALAAGQHNIAVVLGKPDDPHLPDNSIDAVLIANTYHELDHPNVVLQHLLRSLKPGGRLVVVDHGPRSELGEGVEIETEQHEIAPSLAESNIRKEAFEIVRREDQFTVQPEGSHIWWLIVARKSIY